MGWSGVVPQYGHALNLLEAIRPAKRARDPSHLGQRTRVLSIADVMTSAMVSRRRVRKIAR